MTEQIAGASADMRRQVVRLCGVHTLAAIQMATDAVDQDLVTTLMFLAISRENVREVKAAAQASGAYSALHEVPPDNLRQPVTVYALARQLGLAYETARRHANKLVTAGLGERSDEGLIIPASVYAHPSMLAIAQENWRETLRFIRALAAFGVKADAVHGAPPADVRRQAVRLSVEFLLDSLAILTDAMEIDFLGALLCIAITRGNTRHLTEDPSAPYASLNAVPPDEQRRPVSVYALAKTLRLPYETTRRNAGQLVAAGYCERTATGGLIVPMRVLARPNLMAGVELNWDATLRYLNALAEIGVAAG